MHLKYTPSQAESRLYSLEQAAEGINLYANSNNSDFMRFKRKGAMSNPRGKPITSVDKFTYLGSNISSTENDVNLLPSRGVE